MNVLISTKKTILIAIKTCLVLCLFANNPVLADRAPQNKWLSVEQVAEDVSLIHDSFVHIHPGYTRYTDAETLSASWQNIIEKAKQNNGARLGDFYYDVQAALALVRCDHTKVEVPQSVKQQRQRMPAYFPFRWHIIENRALVEFAQQQSPLQHGDEILAIDGHTIDQLIQQYSPLVPVDGYNDHTRVDSIAFSSEFMGGLVEHFAALAAEPTTISEIQFMRDGIIQTAQVRKIGFQEWRSFLNQVQPFYRNFADEVTLQWVDSHTAILAVNTFVNYRKPVDPNMIFEPIFKQLKAKNVKNLILDLRKNGGGSSEPVVSLFSYLISEADSISRETRVKTFQFESFKQYINTWDQNALNPDPAWFELTEDGDFRLDAKLSVLAQTVQPSAYAFKDNLVVLTSKTNSSGSANLLAKLSDLNRATFIGEATGGSVEGPTAGVIFFVTLPHSGIIARLPVQRGYNNVNLPINGKGIVPDISVVPTVEDWLTGKDVTLQRAMEALESRNL